MPIDLPKLNKDFIYQGHGTAAELINGLALIAPLEAKVKARPARIRWAILPVLAVIAALAIFVSGAFVLLAIVAVIGILIWAAKVASTPVLHERVEFLRLALNMLNQDAGSHAHFDVLLGLRAHKEKVSEGPNPRDKSGKQTFFQDAWLNLSGHLSDGTVIRETAADLIRQRTKRNPRGKTKSKERKVGLLRVQLNYNPKVYGDAAVAASRLKNPFRMPSGAQIKSFRTTNKNLSVKALIRGDLSSANLQAAAEAILLGAYRQLNLARRGVAATNAKKGGGQ